MLADDSGRASGVPPGGSAAASPLEGRFGEVGADIDVARLWPQPD
jgi:hypothetical protein